MASYLRVLIVGLVCLVLTAGQLRGQQPPGGEEAGPKPLKVLAGHAGPVHSVAFSPDGKLLASGDVAQMVKLWKAVDGKEVAALRGQRPYTPYPTPIPSSRAGINSLAFAKDGETLATAGSDGTIKLWDVPTAAELITLRGHAGPVLCVAFSPEGKTIASAGEDRFIRFWDTTAGNQRATLFGHGQAVEGLAFDVGGQTLASASRDGTVRLWETASAQQIAVLQLGIPALCVAYAPDDSGFAVGTAQGAITVWTRGGEAGLQRRILGGHDGDVVSLAFAPGGKTLASAGTDGTVKLWDAATGRNLTGISAHPKGAWAVAFSPDGKLLASGGEDRNVKLWDVPALVKLAPAQAAAELVQEPPRPAAPTPGETLAIAEVKRLGGRFLARGFKSSWSPDGARLAFGRNPVGAGISVLDTKTGKVTDVTDSGKDPAWSPGEGRLIAYVRGNAEEEQVWLVEPTGGKPRKLVDGGYPNWSPDGKRVYFQSRSSRKLRVIPVDAEGAQAKDVLDVPWWYPAVPPDAKQVAYRTGSQMIVADLESGKTVKTWPILGGVGFLGGWSPDGRQIAFGGYGGSDPVPFTVVDVQTGQTRRLGNTQATMPAWSPDGSEIALDLRLPAGWEIWAIKSKDLSDLKDEGLQSAPGDNRTVLLGTYYWDVESDKQGDVHAADFFWEQVTDTERYLVPMSGAKARLVPHGDFDKIDPVFIKGAGLSSEKISGSDRGRDLVPGAVVVFRTAEGNLGKLKVEKYRALHDFSFPEAAHLSEDWRTSVLGQPDQEMYHLQVRWRLFQ